MSHYTLTKTRISNLSTLSKVMEDLGLQFEIGEGLTIKGYAETKEVDIKVKGNSRFNHEFEFGFKLMPDGTYEMIYDTYYNENLQREILQNYTKEELTEKFLRKGLSLSDAEVIENGRIKLQVMA